ncbi:MAG: bifunctional 4-hydroxy-2-oxoglutarate aldolase/2-dehydro-3-deoxy-phosphogluconate aldolase [Sediminispirochaetaceae bacterium]
MTGKIINECGIVPVITIHNAEEAVPIAGALLAGGIKVAEITFRTEAAEKALELICERVPDILAGAGTVRTIEQLEKALDAGARFIVTPGFGRRVTEAAVKRHIPIYPGVLTPGEIESVSEYGIRTLKFFPAESFGGTAALKAFAGPYPEIGFIPTGGVGPENFEKYLQLPNVRAVGGSWLTKPSKDGTLDYSLIEKRAREAMDKVAGLKRKIE